MRPWIQYCIYCTGYPCSTGPGAGYLQTKLEFPVHIGTQNLPPSTSFSSRAEPPPYEYFLPAFEVQIEDYQNTRKMRLGDVGGREKPREAARSCEKLREAARSREKSQLQLYISCCLDILARNGLPFLEIFWFNIFENDTFLPSLDYKTI